MEAPEKIYLFENPITETPDDRWLSKKREKTFKKTEKEIER